MFPQNNPNQNVEQQDKPLATPTAPPEPDAVPSPALSQFEPTTVAPEPSVQGAPIQPQKRSKRPLFIAGAIVLILLSAGGVAAALYMSKEKAVTDAFAKVLTATSGSLEGSLKVESLDEPGDLTLVTLKELQFNTTDFSVDMETAITEDETSMTVRGSSVVKADTFAFRIENFRELVSKIMGLSDADTEVLSMYNGLIALLDNKWVVITKDDIESLTGEQDTTKELTCVQDTLKSFRENKTWRYEVVRLYRNNAFVIMSEGKGIESVDGRSSQRYELSLDEQKFRQFNDGVVELSVLKAVDDCIEDDLRAEYREGADETAGDATKETTTTELWVDIVSHEPTRLRVTTTDEQMKSVFDSKVRLNTNPVITLPKAETTLDDLSSEIESLQSQMFSEQVEYETEQSSVLGVRLFR